jgi:hypothetical protein
MKCTKYINYEEKSIIHKKQIIHFQKLQRNIFPNFQ